MDEPHVSEASEKSENRAGNSENMVYVHHHQPKFGSVAPTSWRGQTKHKTKATTTQKMKSKACINAEEKRLYSEIVDV